MSFFNTSRPVIAEVGKLKAIWQALYPKMDIRVLLADATITEGQCVAHDFADIATAAGSTTGITTAAQAIAVAAALEKVIPTSTNAAGEPAFCGVALHDAVAGGAILVCVGGFCPKVLFSGATDVTAGEPLVAASTAGSVIKYAAGTHTNACAIGIAVSTETDTAGYVACILKPTLP